MDSTIKVLRESGKNVFITGGNSGIGLHAVISFLKFENYVFIPIKSQRRKDQFLAKLAEYLEPVFFNKYLEIINEIDLSDLRNIKKISDFFETKEVKLDILILNAGIQYTGSKYPKVSRQGVELTFAINHLSHFVLANNLIPYIAERTGSRIIITSSDVHDPKSPGGNVGKKAGLSDFSAFRETIMGTFNNFNADKAYKNSKLCNILFAKELSRILQNKQYKVSVITWAPGLVIPEDGLGFFRYSSKFNKIGYKIFSTLVSKVLGISENVNEAGKLLYLISMNQDLNDLNYIHLSNRLISYRKHKLLEANVSKEANDYSLSKKLWQLSEEVCDSFAINLVDI